MRRAGRFRGVFSRVRPASAPFSSYGTLAPGQRKSPPSDLFMALRLRRLPCAAASSLPKRSAERADGAFFLCGGTCVGVSGEGLFPHYPGAWFSLSRAFCRSRAGSKDASASGRAPYSGGTSVLYRSCGAQGVSGVFFRGYGLPQRLFPLTGTPAAFPALRKERSPKGPFHGPAPEEVPLCGRVLFAEEFGREG